ncbi:hypothetical protein C8Q74DRAFT_628834 [Fomes fomentarius]|nr:hypothetical protein C8Q74DRAFT_628834 [Fomes fomentarius]
MPLRIFLFSFATSACGPSIFEYYAASSSVACAPQQPSAATGGAQQSLHLPTQIPDIVFFWTRQCFRNASSDIPSQLPGGGAGAYRWSWRLTASPSTTYCVRCERMEDGGGAHGNIGLRLSNSPNMSQTCFVVWLLLLLLPEAVTGRHLALAACRDCSGRIDPNDVPPMTTPPDLDHPTIRGRCRHRSIHTVAPAIAPRSLGFSVSRFLRSPHCPTGKRTSD